MKKFLLSGIAVLFSFSIFSQNTALLKLNLEKNKLYRMKAVSEQNITQTINGNAQTVETKVNYTISMKMIDATPDLIVAEIHFDTLVTNTNSMGKLISINSAVEGNIKSSEMGDILSCIMNRLSKSALYVKIDFTGKPVEIINLKMLPDLVLKDTSSITLTGPMAVAVKKQIAGIISDDNLKTMIGMFTWVLPGRQVSTGESWDVMQQTNSGGMLLDIKTSYHLDGINGNYANVTAESVIKAAANAVPFSSSGATVSYDNLQGMSKSNMVIDILTGLIARDNAKSHISGNLGITAPGVSMQMPMDISGESNVITLQ